MSFCDAKKIKRGKIKPGCVEVIKGYNKGVTPDYIWPCRKGPTGRRGPSVPGAPGEPGPTGYPGIQGNPGIQGAPGDQGPVGGTLGPPGFIGNQGAPGDQGYPGVQGAVGSKGSTGSQGEPGTQGDPGAQGMMGDQGAPGIQGAVGLQGAPGDQGAPGIQGAVGLQGAPGDQGQPGIQGAIGSQGTPGTQGSPGQQGSPGTQGTPALNYAKHIYVQAPATFTTTAYLPTFFTVPLSSPLSFSDQTNSEAILYINVAATVTDKISSFASTSYYLQVDGGANGTVFNRTIWLPGMYLGATSVNSCTFSIRCSQAIYVKNMNVGVPITITLSLSCVNGTSEFLFSLAGAGFITAYLVYY